MCLGSHNLLRVGRSAAPQQLPDHKQRHRLDTYDNFFARARWNATALAQRVAVRDLLKTGTLISLMSAIRSAMFLPLGIIDFSAPAGNPTDFARIVHLIDGRAEKYPGRMKQFA